MKRIASIQDISCLGRCSLTVALPVISAMGVECAIVPTAVLSAHTAFPGFVSRDLSDQLPAIADHWRSQQVHFDALYTGYIASAPQVPCPWRAMTGLGGVSPRECGIRTKTGMYSPGTVWIATRWRV